MGMTASTVMNRPLVLLVALCCLLAACAYAGWYTRINWNGVP
jgi:hypothetical protein